MRELASRNSTLNMFRHFDRSPTLTQFDGITVCSDPKPLPMVLLGKFGELYIWPDGQFYYYKTPALMGANTEIPDEFTERFTTTLAITKGNGCWARSRTLLLNVQLTFSPEASEADDMRRACDDGEVHFRGTIGDDEMVTCGTVYKISGYAGNDVINTKLAAKVFPGEGNDIVFAKRVFLRK